MQNFSLTSKKQSFQVRQSISEAFALVSYAHYREYSPRNRRSKFHVVFMN